jgi:hypothetical protein
MYIIKIIYFTNVYNYSYESILKYVHFIFIHEIIVLFIYSNLILFRRRSLKRTIQRGSCQGWARKFKILIRHVGSTR